MFSVIGAVVRFERNGVVGDDICVGSESIHHDRCIRDRCVRDGVAGLCSQVEHNSYVNGDLGVLRSDFNDVGMVTIISVD
jgi:hypothetical protein